MASLQGKTAVITGAARGLGAAFAERLAADGAAIAAVDILDCAETVQKIERAGGRAIGISADISSQAAVAELADQVRRELGPAQILVNNAGLHPNPQPFENLSFDYWRRVMSVNLDAMFLLIQAFLPDMRASGWGARAAWTSIIARFRMSAAEP